MYNIFKKTIKNIEMYLYRFGALEICSILAVL